MMEEQDDDDDKDDDEVVGIDAVVCDGKIRVEVHHHHRHHRYLFQYSIRPHCNTKKQIEKKIE